MNEAGGYLGVIGWRQKQSWIIKDLMIGTQTNKMSAEQLTNGYGMMQKA